MLLNPSLLQPGRIGLLTHSAAVTADLARGVDALLAAEIGVHCLISPEHGYWGTGQAGDGHDEGHDHTTGLPVLDAYGKDADGLESLLAESGIDQVVIDLQDIGCRFYRYMWSMTDTMTACARLGMPVTVLDRPSPLAVTPLGPGLDADCASFVGRYGIPLRHGARLGRSPARSPSASSTPRSSCTSSTPPARTGPPRGSPPPRTCPRSPQWRCIRERACWRGRPCAKGGAPPAPSNSSARPGAGPRSQGRCASWTCRA
ncbi:DUF1343 domain-containing protein [Brachybacterium sp. Z12]|uniref:DUF1343 domain-containing protein n=1 Tax=Brachybacterium sp. Z12 TaxID=2759167 RepID=UPI0018603650|nr:DUF1343 domain-containing protein [Brachybacterium sp. Z12]QNN83649.1 DUF1343 domain-containing protein [Brachybacterium sp. Z12]